MAAMRVVGLHSSSMRLDVPLPNDVLPFCGFGLKVCGALFGHAANWIEAERRHPFLHVRQRDGLDDLSVEQRDDFLGRSGWNDYGKPYLALDVWIPSFRHCWYVGYCLYPCLSCH